MLDLAALLAVNLINKNRWRSPALAPLADSAAGYCTRATGSAPLPSLLQKKTDWRVTGTLSRPHQTLPSTADVWWVSTASRVCGNGGRCSVAAIPPAGVLQGAERRQSLGWRQQTEGQGKVQDYASQTQHHHDEQRHFTFAPIGPLCCGGWILWC